MTNKVSAHLFSVMWDEYSTLAERLENLNTQYAELFNHQKSQLDRLFRFSGNKGNAGKDAVLEFKITEVFGLNVKKDWGKYDLTAHYKDPLRGFEPRPLDDDKLDYLSENEIMLITAYDIEWCPEQMLKLANARARLKVLLVPAVNKEDRHSLLKKFSAIISHFNKRYPENDSTEYMVIAGKRAMGKLEWKKSKINTQGKVEKLSNMVVNKGAKN